MKRLRTLGPGAGFLENPNALVFILLVLLTFAFAHPSAAASRSANDANSRSVMVLLKKECFGCHNQEKKKGGLILTSRERLLEGGQDGAVVVPGKPVHVDTEIAFLQASCLIAHPMGCDMI